MFKVGGKTVQSCLSSGWVMCGVIGAVELVRQEEDEWDNGKACAEFEKTCRSCLTKIGPKMLEIG